MLKKPIPNKRNRPSAGTTYTMGGAQPAQRVETRDERRQREKEELAAARRAELAAARKAADDAILEGYRATIKLNVAHYLRDDRVTASIEQRIANKVVAAFDAWIVHSLPERFAWERVAREARHERGVGAGVAPVSLASREAGQLPVGMPPPDPGQNPQARPPLPKGHASFDDRIKGRAAYQDALRKLGLQDPSLGFATGPNGRVT